MKPYNYQKINEWIPADNFILEENAMEVAKSDYNSLVIAGPGAGKTELLAQRACYLLQTNSCPYPQKILAISFKKDAADNLRERVEKRCGKELAKRFESKTFDAFSKMILDRFYKGIPVEYRPLKNYDIATPDDIRRAYSALSIKFPSGSSSRVNKILSDRIVANRLDNHLSDGDESILKVWRLLTTGSDFHDLESRLSFQMISRLSEWLIRTNTYLNNAINNTYSHVFLDEFQDTTEMQYELVRSCFLDSKPIITAVGDSKQRIMVWAGALRNIFETYSTDFQAKENKLVMNHRSAPKLVELQRMMYNSLNEKDIAIQSSDKWDDKDGSVYVRSFPNHQLEAETISQEIINLLERGIKSSDICILVKQQAPDYGKAIIKELKSKGIKARNEADYQDFLKEEIVKLLISYLNIALRDRAPDDWNFIKSYMMHLNGIDNDSDISKILMIHSEIRETTKVINRSFGTSSEEDTRKSVDRIISLIGIDKIKGQNQQYKNGKFFNDLLAKFSSYLWKEYEEAGDWIVAVETLEGKHSIPIMTIHKSKGLEFNTIFFIGLEDSAFWSFSTQPEEDRCAFFVALSRAKERIDFTFSENRPVGFNANQSRSNIAEFYELLKNTNFVEEINYN